MGSVGRTPRHKADDKPVVFKTKMSKQQIEDTLFAPLDDPKLLANEWCPLSEARLLQLVLKYRPIGINKHINMDLIVMYMKHIYAKEDGVNMFLNDADLQEYAAGLGLPPDERVGRFEPSYSIRPTAEQIWEKISAWYDTNSLEFKEMIALPLPPELTAISEFELPKSYFTDIQNLDSDDERAAQKMHCSKTSELPKIPDALSTSLKQRKRSSEKRPRNSRHSSKRPERSKSEKSRRSRSKTERGRFSSVSKSEDVALADSARPTGSNKNTCRKRRSSDYTKSVNDPPSSSEDSNPRRLHQSKIDSFLFSRRSENHRTISGRKRSLSKKSVRLCRPSGRSAHNPTNKRRVSHVLATDGESATNGIRHLMQIRLRSLKSQIGIFDSDSQVDTADPTTSQGVSLTVPSHGSADQSVLHEVSSGPCEPILEISGPKEWISGPASQGLPGLDSTPEFPSSLQDDPHVPFIKEELPVENVQEHALSGQHMEETPKISLQRTASIPLVEKLMGGCTLESSPSKTSSHAGIPVSSSPEPGENSVLKISPLEIVEEENNPPSLTRKARRLSRAGELKAIFKRKRGLKEKQNRK
ncbi:hypothetical protein V3C99_014242 [Haemonchus contortus]